MEQSRLAADRDRIVYADLLEREPKDAPVETPLERETFTCSHCKALIYNRDTAGRPTEGAPAPHFVSIEHKEVCCTCFQLSVIADTNYWRQVERDIKEKREKYADHVKRLNGDKDYFTGS